MGVYFYWVFTRGISIEKHRFFPHPRPPHIRAVADTFWHRLHQSSTDLVDNVRCTCGVATKWCPWCTPHPSANPLSKKPLGAIASPTVIAARDMPSPAPLSGLQWFVLILSADVCAACALRDELAGRLTPASRTVSRTTTPQSIGTSYALIHVPCVLPYIMYYTVDIQYI